jgi:class 3 adenylate cyclase/pimeloyl-ACP methyl ester carboxylesterase
VTDVSETRYTQSADGTSLAYQLSGNGPIELAFLSRVHPIDLLSDDPGYVRLRRRLASFSRTVWFDDRGWGASEGDPKDSRPGETSDADLMAVLQAVGFDRPSVVAEDSNGVRAIHFAVTHPERISALVLVNSYAHYVREGDYPWGIHPEDIDRVVDVVRESWGTAAALEVVAPERVADERFRSWFARSSRFAGGPDQIAAVVRASLKDDVRPLLPSVSVPTLVLHRKGDRFIHVGAGRYLAEHIPGARLVVLPGDAHLFFVGDTDALVDEIEEFLTGGHQPPEGEVVTTSLLFTDIVSSTEQSASMGHRAWTALVDRHDAMVRASLRQHKGREVKTTGDGFLATFDATTRAVRAGMAIVAAAGQIGVDVRVGVHTGEVELRSDDAVGLPVSIARRICDRAGPGEVFVSEAVNVLILGSGIHSAAQGVHVLKGVPGEWRLFSVTG